MTEKERCIKELEDLIYKCPTFCRCINCEWKLENNKGCKRTKLAEKLYKAGYRKLNPYIYDPYLPNVYSI